MKTLLAFTLSLIATAIAAFGTELEARLLRFSGETPPAANLVALLEANAFAYATPFSATLLENKTFEYRALTPVQYPTNFDDHGKADATETRDTGIAFSGDATLLDGQYNLNLNFSLVERANTILYPHKSGSTMAQPVFRSDSMKTNIVARPNEWVLLEFPGNRTPAPSGPDRQVLLVRVRP